MEEILTCGEPVILSTVPFPRSGLSVRVGAAAPFPVNAPLKWCCRPPQNVDLPDAFSPELKSLLEGLLQREVSKRLGCHGGG